MYPLASRHRSDYHPQTTNEHPNPLALRGKESDRVLPLQLSLSLSQQHTSHLLVLTPSRPTATMKLSHLLISFLLATPARSSWPSTGSSSSTPGRLRRVIYSFQSRLTATRTTIEYENWSNYELYRYLEAHSVATRDYHSRKDLLDSVKFSWDPYVARPQSQLPF